MSIGKAEQAKKDFAVILGFFGITPSGNFFTDLTSLASMDLSNQNIEKNLYKFMFNCYDNDGNGSIDAKELKTLLVDIGNVSNDPDLINISDDEVAEALKNIDSDGNGTVEFSEFLAWISASE